MCNFHVFEPTTKVEIAIFLLLSPCVRPIGVAYLHLVA